MPLDEVVDLAGGDAGHDMRRQRVEDLGGERGRRVRIPAKPSGPWSLMTWLRGFGAVFGATWIYSVMGVR